MTVKLGGSAGSVSLQQQMMKGDDGGYYFPSVDENSNLSWIASEEGMPIPSTVNIKGPKGDKGDIGVYIGETEPTDNSILVWLNTDAEISEDLATKEYVNDAIAKIEVPEIDVDLSEYYTRTETDQYFATIGYVDESIPDLSPYALKTEIPDVSNFANKTDIPDTSNFATKDQIPDVSNFATKDQIPNMSGYYTKEEIDAMIPASGEEVSY